MQLGHSFAFYFGSVNWKLGDAPYEKQIKYVSSSVHRNA